MDNEETKEDIIKRDILLIVYGNGIFDAREASLIQAIKGRRYFRITAMEEVEFETKIKIKE